MNRRVSFAALCCFALTFCTCSDLGTSPRGRRLPPGNHELVTIRQGIWGNVWLWQGDFMPSPDTDLRGSITAVSREVCIYEPTSMQETVPSIGTRFTRINSRLVATVTSQSNGLFQVSLSPGRYSLVVKEDSTFYANWFDMEGYISQVTVVKDSVTKFQINLTYGAVY